MSLLTIVQNAADAIGVERPSFVIGNTAPIARQMLSLCNIEGKLLSTRTQWQELNLVATFTTVAAENQGAMTTLAPGYKYLLNQTMWNRSQDTPIFGPATPQRWQAYQAAPVTGPYYTFRILDNNLRFIPAPTAGMTIAFEYASKNWCQNSAGTATYESWNADTDTAKINEDMLMLGLIWRYKKAKELDYGEDMITYETEVMKEMARNAAAASLNMAGPMLNSLQYPLIQEGSWPLT